MSKGKEGYLLLDNRHAPGPDGTRFLEAATITCSHCHTQLIRNPERTRERAWCWNCDKYICDSCGALRQMGAECRPLNGVLDEMQNAAIRALGKG